MIPEDAYEGRLLIGDKVAVNGREYTVWDLVQTDVKGQHMAVFVGEREYYDISEVEKI